MPGETRMRTVEEVKASLPVIYQDIAAMFAHWHRGMHQRFMDACWDIYDLRQELAEITGSREEAHNIVKNAYSTVFYPEQEQPLMHKSDSTSVDGTR
jgi:hypothetical protein